MKLWDPTGFEESGGGEGGGGEGGEGGESGQGRNSDGGCASNCGGAAGGGQQAAPAGAPSEAGGSENPTCQGSSCGGGAVAAADKGEQIAQVTIPLVLAAISLPVVANLVLSPEQKRELAAGMAAVGYDDAHDLKDNRGGGGVDIYKDKRTGDYYLWNGRKGGDKDRVEPK